MEKEVVRTSVMENNGTLRPTVSSDPRCSPSNSIELGGGKMSLGGDASEESCHPLVLVSIPHTLRN